MVPQIVPVILSHTQEDYTHKIRLLEGNVERVQVDLMDGKFVNNTTIGYAEMRNVPTSLFLEAQLMVNDPVRVIGEYEKAGARLVEIHIESTPDVSGAIRAAREANLSVGIAINAETPIERAKPYFGAVDLILVMSVSLGFEGQAFLPHTYERIRKLRELGWNGIIEVDGGVNEEHLEPLIEAGANYLAMNTAIWGTPDPITTLRRMQSLINPKS